MMLSTALRPVHMNEFAKGAASFGLLRSLSDEFRNGSQKFSSGILADNTDIVGAISVV